MAEDEFTDSTDEPAEVGEGELGETEGARDLPAFQTGGRVDRTGIALVHEGEYIVPAPGSEATITPAGPGGQVTYTFPVEVEVIGELSEAQLRTVAEYVFDELDTALRAWG